MQETALLRQDNGKVVGYLCGLCNRIFEGEEGKSDACECCDPEIAQARLTKMRTHEIAGLKALPSVRWQAFEGALYNELYDEFHYSLEDLFDWATSHLLKAGLLSKTMKDAEVTAFVWHWVREELLLFPCKELHLEITMEDIVGILDSKFGGDDGVFELEDEDELRAFLDRWNKRQSWVLYTPTYSHRVEITHPCPACDGSGVVIVGDTNTAMHCAACHVNGSSSGNLLN